MYAITATVETRTADGWQSSRQVPTFYLDERAQGIVSEDHARRIASDIIAACIDPADRATELHVCAVKV